MTTSATTITENNIFTKGMLISLHQGNYAGRKRMDKSQMENLPTEIVRGVHDLFEKSFKILLQDISAFDRETRHSVKYVSVPFPIDGVYFISSERIEKIIEMLEARKAQRLELIEKAVENYDEAVKTFAEKYPAYYQHAKAKYLTKNQFLERFYCKYQFIKISAPGKDDALISPEIYKKEMEKFKETIAEMKNEVVSTIYTELLKTTNRLKKQCTDGVPSQRTLNTLNEYMKRVEEVYSDFVDRADLKKALKAVKAQVLGVTAEELRDNDASREKFRGEISSLLEGIKALPNIQLRRAIDF